MYECVSEVSGHALDFTARVATPNENKMSCCER
jgi:hypothetical protein